MLTPERHRMILDLLARKEVVHIQELVDATHSSESTIRRDLSQLETEKKLKRVHGGASLLQQKGEEPSVFEKSTKNLQEKDAIAKYAASLIRDKDCVFLDAGTTVMQMLPHIQAKNIKVVTNGFTHLDRLLELNIDTFLTGGLIKGKTGALIGRGAMDGLRQFRFDKCFIGVNGIHRDFGYTTPDPEEAMIKQLAIELSQESYILADRTKLHEVTFSKITELDQAMIITGESDREVLADFRTKTTVKAVTT